MNDIFISPTNNISGFFIFNLIVQINTLKVVLINKKQNLLHTHIYYSYYLNAFFPLIKT